MAVSDSVCTAPWTFIMLAEMTVEEYNLNFYFSIMKCNNKAHIFHPKNLTKKLDKYLIQNILVMETSFESIKTVSIRTQIHASIP
jgi:hypothetical protein